MFFVVFFFLTLDVTSVRICDAVELPEQEEDEEDHVDDLELGYALLDEDEAHHQLSEVPPDTEQLPVSAGNHDLLEAELISPSLNVVLPPVCVLIDDFQPPPPCVLLEDITGISLSLEHQFLLRRKRFINLYKKDTKLQKYLPLTDPIINIEGITFLSDGDIKLLVNAISDNKLFSCNGVDGVRIMHMGF